MLAEVWTTRTGIFTGQSGPKEIEEDKEGTFGQTCDQRQKAVIININYKLFFRPFCNKLTQNALLSCVKEKGKIVFLCVSILVWIIAQFQLH